jgi:DUF4097 and DUF4098 domain-containing protein YvlB
MDRKFFNSIAFMLFGSVSLMNAQVANVSTVKLNNGLEMPQFGLGIIALIKKAAVCFVCICFAVTAYCQNDWKSKPVNVQEISLDNIREIEISFNEENVSVLQGTTDKLVIKEYRNKDNGKFFAKITRSGDKLSIKRGFWLSWRLFSIVRSGIEISIPATYKNAVNIRTKNGNITCALAENADNVALKTTSGSITLDLPENLTADFSIKTVSGKLSIPFPEKLSGEKSQQFATGEGRPDKNIIIKTISGNINITQR